MQEHFSLRAFSNTRSLARLVRCKQLSQLEIGLDAYLDLDVTKYMIKTDPIRSRVLERRLQKISKLRTIVQLQFSVK